MKYTNIIEGSFIKRINRFIAEVLIDQKIELVHVKNTGRCKELFVLGAKVYLQRSDNPKRKTKYSLISIYKGDILINIDSQVPNQVVYDAILNNQIEDIQDVDFIKREVTFGKSRLDLYFEKDERKGFIEVKGCTLEENNIVRFPDAPTERGRKHIAELIEAKKAGYEAYIFFLIQMDGVTRFIPNSCTDKAFADILYHAIDEGVNVLIYNSIIEKNSIVIHEKGKLFQ